MSGVMGAVPAGHKEIASITAGAGAGIVGFNRGSFGSTYPDAANIKGLPVVVLEDQNVAGVLILILDGTVAADYFASITVNGVTQLTSAAAFVSGAQSQWDFPDPVGLVNATTYQVTYT